MTIFPVLLRSFIRVVFCFRRRIITLLALFLVAGVSVANDLEGVWRGSYECASKADLTLFIEQTRPGQIQAEFVFQMISGAHRGAAGRYVMQGHYKNESHEFVLKPVRHIDMPPNFVMVSLSGLLIKNETGEAELMAQVQNPQCQAFGLMRSAPISSDQAYAEYMAKTLSPVSVEKPMPVVLDDGFCERVVAWSNILEAEHPYPGSVYTDRVASHAELIRPLFTDSRLRPVIGKAFTDLDRQGRTT